jgi:hypothetical protein
LERRVIAIVIDEEGEPDIQIDDSISAAELLLAARLLDTKADEALEAILHPELED